MNELLKQQLYRIENDRQVPTYDLGEIIPLYREGSAVDDTGLTTKSIFRLNIPDLPDNLEFTGTLATKHQYYHSSISNTSKPRPETIFRLQANVRPILGKIRGSLRGRIMETRDRMKRESTDLDSIINNDFYTSYGPSFHALAAALDLGDYVLPLLPSEQDLARGSVIFGSDGAHDIPVTDPKSIVPHMQVKFVRLSD